MSIYENNHSPLYRELAEQMKARPESDGNPLLAARILLGADIRDGVDPPDTHEVDVLLRGLRHHIFAAAGTGKTWLALWLAKRRLDAGETVLYLDAENGRRIVSERLESLSVDPERIDEGLVYLLDPDLSLSPEHKTAFEELLDEVQPDLVIFDSWINFLGTAGLSENENQDIVDWATAFLKPTWRRGITSVVLDHVPHEGNRHRGATRKRDEVDVQWALTNPRPFDRDTVGEITLQRRKDREGWLPLTVHFSVGGSKDGFLFSKSSGTVETAGDDGLTPSARRGLEALRTFGETGARFTEWLKACEPLARSTFGDAKQTLERRQLVYQGDDKRYYPAVRKSPDSPTGLFSDSSDSSPSESGVLKDPDVRTNRSDGIASDDAEDYLEC